MKTNTKGLHVNNKHKSGYNFETLCKVYPDLEPFVFENKYQTQTIDFAIPEAVKALNTALLFAHYKVKYWKFPDTNLCPPIPGRVDYIHYLADLLKSSGITENITVLDIGTGASCIYPILGHAAYNWQFVASDIDATSLKFAQTNINENVLSAVITLIHQTDESQILNGILKPSDKLTACMCNPPFYKDAAEALEATTRKLKGLGNNSGAVLRNFGGEYHELCYKGGEKAFLHNYLYQSSLYKTQCFWYTSLVSNKEHLKSMKTSLTKLGANEVKTIEMKHGNKTSRIVVWTFLTKEEQKQW